MRLSGYDIRGEIWGTKGSIQIGYYRQTPILMLTPEGITHDAVPYFMERFENAYLAQIQNFVEHVQKGLPPSDHGSGCHGGAADQRWPRTCRCAKAGPWICGIMRPRFARLIALAMSVSVLLVGILRAWQPDQDIDITLVTKALDSEWWQRVKAGAEDAAKANPGVRLAVLAPEREVNIDQQVSILEDQITKKVAALAVAPTGAAELIPVLDRAHAAGIPVIIFDTDINWASKLSFVGVGQSAGRPHCGRVHRQDSRRQGQSGGDPRDFGCVKRMKTAWPVFGRPFAKLAGYRLRGRAAGQQRTRVGYVGDGESGNPISRLAGRLRHQRPDGAGRGGSGCRSQSDRQNRAWEWMPRAKRCGQSKPAGWRATWRCIPRCWAGAQSRPL